MSIRIGILTYILLCILIGILMCVLIGILTCIRIGIHLSKYKLKYLSLAAQKAIIYQTGLNLKQTPPTLLVYLSGSQATLKTFLLYSNYASVKQFLSKKLHAHTIPTQDNHVEIVRI